MRFTHENDYDSIILPIAQKYNVDPNIIKGVIGQESNFIYSAYRFEPYISPTTGKPRTWLTPNSDFPNGGDASFGLMQILSRTGRLLGLTGPKENLYDPATNITLGTKYLSNLIAKYTSQGKPLDNALSEYNGGSGSSFGGAPAYGPFNNQAYVNNVLANISYFQSAGSSYDDYSNNYVDSTSGQNDFQWENAPTVTTGIGIGAGVIGIALAALFLLNRK